MIDFYWLYIMLAVLGGFLVGWALRSACGDIYVGSLPMRDKKGRFISNKSLLHNQLRKEVYGKKP